MHFVVAMALLAAQSPEVPEAPAAPAEVTEESPESPAEAPAMPPAQPPGEALTVKAKDKSKVLVLDLGALGTGSENARLITGVVASLAGECEGADVLTGADLRTMMELEATKMAAGCDEQSCLVEIADSLGARFVIHGDVGALGASYVVTLNLFEAGESASRGRKSIEVKSLEEMPKALRPVVNDLLKPLGGIPLAQEAEAPAEDGLSTLVIVGGATAAAGALATVGFGLATLVADGIASEPTNAVADKEAAIGWGRITLVGTIAGVAIAGVGAGILAAGLME